MEFIELTRPDDTKVLINVNCIVFVSIFENNTLLILSGNRRQEIKESYETILKMVCK